MSKFILVDRSPEETEKKLQEFLREPTPPVPGSDPYKVLAIHHTRAPRKAKRKAIPIENVVLEQDPEEPSISKVNFPSGGSMVVSDVSLNLRDSYHPLVVTKSFERKQVFLSKVQADLDSGLDHIKALENLNIGLMSYDGHGFHGDLYKEVAISMMLRGKLNPEVRKVVSSWKPNPDRVVRTMNDMSSAELLSVFNIMSEQNLILDDFYKKARQFHHLGPATGVGAVRKRLKELSTMATFVPFGTNDGVINELAPYTVGNTIALRTVTTPLVGVPKTIEEIEGFDEDRLRDTLRTIVYPLVPYLAADVAYDPTLTERDLKLYITKSGLRNTWLKDQVKSFLQTRSFKIPDAGSAAGEGQVFMLKPGVLVDPYEQGVLPPDQWELVQTRPPDYLPKIGVQPLDRQLIDAALTTYPMIPNPVLLGNLFNVANNNFAGNGDGVALTYRLNTVYSGHNQSYRNMVAKNGGSYKACIRKHAQGAVEYFIDLLKLELTTEPLPYVKELLYVLPSSWEMKWTLGVSSSEVDDKGLITLLNKSVADMRFKHNLMNPKAAAGFPYGELKKGDVAAHAMNFLDCVYVHIDLFKYEGFIELSKCPAIRNIFGLIQQRAKSEPYPLTTPHFSSLEEALADTDSNERTVNFVLENTELKRARTIFSLGFFPSVAPGKLLGVLTQSIPSSGLPTGFDGTKLLFERMNADIIHLLNFSKYHGGMGLLLSRIQNTGVFEGINRPGFMATYSDNFYISGELSDDLDLTRPEYVETKTPNLGTRRRIPKGRRVLASLDGKKWESCSWTDMIRYNFELVLMTLGITAQGETETLYWFLILCTRESLSGGFIVAADILTYVAFNASGSSMTFLNNDIKTYMVLAEYKRLHTEKYGVENLVYVDLPLLTTATESYGANITVELIVEIPALGTEFLSHGESLDIDFLGCGVGCFENQPNGYDSGNFYYPILQMDRTEKSIVLNKTPRPEDAGFIGVLSAMKYISLLIVGHCFTASLGPLLAHTVLSTKRLVPLMREYARAVSKINGELEPEIQAITEDSEFTSELARLNTAYIQSLADKDDGKIVEVLNEGVAHFRKIFVSINTFKISSEALVNLGESSHTAKGYDSVSVSNQTYNKAKTLLTLEKDMFIEILNEISSGSEVVSPAYTGAVLLAYLIRHGNANNYESELTPDPVGKVASVKFLPKLEKRMRVMLNNFNFSPNHIHYFRALMKKAIMERPDISTGYPDFRAKVSAEKDKIDEEKAKREELRRRAQMVDKQKREAADQVIKEAKLREKRAKAELKSKREESRDVQTLADLQKGKFQVSERFRSEAAVLYIEPQIPSTYFRKTFSRTVMTESLKSHKHKSVLNALCENLKIVSQLLNGDLRNSIYPDLDQMFTKLNDVRLMASKGKYPTIAEVHRNSRDEVTNDDLLDLKVKTGSTTVREKIEAELANVHRLPRNLAKILSLPPPNCVMWDIIEDFEDEPERTGLEIQKDTLISGGVKYRVEHYDTKLGRQPKLSELVDTFDMPFATFLAVTSGERATFSGPKAHIREIELGGDKLAVLKATLFAINLAYSVTLKGLHLFSAGIVTKHPDDQSEMILFLGSSVTHSSLHVSTNVSLFYYLSMDTSKIPLSDAEKEEMEKTLRKRFKEGLAENKRKTLPKATPAPKPRAKTLSVREMLFQTKKPPETSGQKLSTGAELGDPEPSATPAADAW